MRTIIVETSLNSARICGALTFRSYPLLGLLLLSLLCHACSSRNEDAIAESYDLSDATPATIEDIFSTVEAFELQQNNRAYPNASNQLFKAEDDILIRDNDWNIFLFDGAGKMLSNSATVLGKSHGEYEILMGCSYNPFSSTIQIVTPMTMLSYDKNFKFIKETELPVVMGADENSKNLFYGEIFNLSDNLYILSPSGPSPDPHRFMIFDAKANKVIKEINFKDDVRAPASMQNNIFFTMSDGTILFKPMALCDYVFKLNEDYSFEPVMKFSVSKNGITDADIEAHNHSEEELAMYLLNCDKTIPLSIMPGDEHIFVNLSVGNTLRTMSSVVIDRKTGAQKSVPFYKDGRYVFPRVQIIDKDTAYAVCEKEMLLENPDLLLNDNALHNRVETFENGALVLLKYRLR